MYISAPHSSTQRAKSELHGFEKVLLQSGEEKVAKVEIGSYAGSFWNEAEGGWTLESGLYEARIGTGNGVHLVGSFEISSPRSWLGV